MDELKPTLSVNEIIQSMELLPIAAVVFEENQKIKYVNRAAQQFISKHPQFFINNKVASFIEEVKRLKKGTNHLIQQNNSFYTYYFEPIVVKNIVEAVIVYVDLNNKIQPNYETYKEESEDLKALFETSFDVMYVSDNTGKTLRVSSSCKEFWSEDADKLVGRNVVELEKEGVFKPSITRLVLEKKEKVTTIQTTINNKKLLVTGAPIKNEQGEIIRIVNASRDITEIENLQNEVSALKTILEEYQLEIAQMQHSIFGDNKIIFQSKLMGDCLELARRLSKVNSTVLITGESGVGKELVANYIHLLSKRNNKPIVKINCSAIPENLLEYELFGSDKGVFNNDDKGKMGMFEFANEGTLYLDEVGDITYALQTKLLRVLQEQEIRRLGSNQTIKLDVRIIASTNKDLFEMVKKGLFREDLYYRLNVVPMQLPSLRARPEDIAPLANYFVSFFNQQYDKNKKLSSEAIYYLENYTWPGNVRELRNIIERAVVTVEKEDIVDELISLIPSISSANEDAVDVSKIIPLKECIEIAERKLLALASEKYSSTIEIAKVLEVNQSTISRKLLKQK